MYSKTALKLIKITTATLERHNLIVVKT